MNNNNTNNNLESGSESGSDIFWFPKAVGVKQYGFERLTTLLLIQIRLLSIPQNLPEHTRLILKIV